MSEKDEDHANGESRPVDTPEDSEAPSDGEQYHLAVGSGDVADTVLLPGNPERVDRIVDCWDEHDVVGEHREFRTATGTYAGTPLSVTATGIGSPSAAIAVEELARVGAESMIRVGSCGAIREEVSVGDLVITSGAVRQEGTSDEYVRPDYPATADDRIVAALVAAAETLGYEYHVGLTCSTDSFYAGQSRPGFEGFTPPDASERIDALRDAGVYNFEMEASAILTLASIYGLRAGAVCAVYANRVTGEFRTDGDGRAAETASLAAAYLASMDRTVEESDADRWHAGLSVEDPRDVE